jgi:hypothetical protein
MLLVPRQLRRAGMTGNVPYYGGRFTPAQAYAAAHPSQVPPGPGVPVRSATAPAGQPVRTGPHPDPVGALQHLLDTGVITAAEYEDLRARVVA